MWKPRMVNVNYARILLFGMVSLFITGCTSITSTLLTRDEGNSQWEQVTHLKGVPITLKVPTHVKVYIYETIYLETVEVGGIKKTEPLQMPIPIRDFATEFIKTEKIFTVDFKRPAAGSYNLDVSLEEQYLKEISHDVTDKTIETVGDLVSEIGGLPGFTLAGDDGKGAGAALTPIKTVVAVGVFEIDDPSFEMNLTEFINCHMNQSHDAWVVPPGAKFNRESVTGGSGMREPLCPTCPSGTSFIPQYHQNLGAFAPEISPDTMEETANY